jgi:hypothetical protein
MGLTGRPRLVVHEDRAEGIPGDGRLQNRPRPSACGHARLQIEGRARGNDLGRDHFGAALAQPDQVGLVAVPAHEIERVQEPRRRGGPRRPFQEFCAAVEIVPGRAQQGDVVRRPVGGGIVPDRGNGFVAARGQRSGERMVVGIEVGKTAAGDERDAHGRRGGSATDAQGRRAAHILAHRRRDRNADASGRWRQCLDIGHCRMTIR